MSSKSWELWCSVCCSISACSSGVRLGAYSLPHLRKSRVCVDNNIEHHRHVPNVGSFGSVVRPELRYDLVGRRQICPELRIVLHSCSIFRSHPREIVHCTDPDHPSPFLWDNLHSINEMNISTYIKFKNKKYINIYLKD